MSLPSKTPDPKAGTASAILTVVPTPEEKAKAAAAKRPGLANPFVQFMRAYADQVDKEVKAILEL